MVKISHTPKSLTTAEQAHKIKGEKEDKNNMAVRGN